MTSEEKSDIKNRLNPDDIVFIDLIRTIWTGRKIIFKSVLLFAIVGIIFSYLTPEEYRASITLVPQSDNSTSKIGGLSSLASLAGFDIDMSTGGANEISPILYPQIMESVPFQLELMQSKFIFEEIDYPISLFDYYTNIGNVGILAVIKKYTIKLPRLLMGLVRKNSQESNFDNTVGLLSISDEQEEVRKIIDERLTLDVNIKEGYLKLRSSFPEASLSAQVAERAQFLLQSYVTDMKIENATSQLEFISKRCEEKKEESLKAQIDFATFIDENMNITNSVVKIEGERLNYEYQLAFEVYSQLAKQKEQAIIQVKEDTPVFSVIQPANIPTKRHKPKRMKLLIFWSFFGGVFGIVYLFSFKYFQSAKKYWLSI